MHTCIHITVRKPRETTFTGKPFNSVHQAGRRKFGCGFHLLRQEGADGVPPERWCVRQIEYSDGPKKTVTSLGL